MDGMEVFCISFFFDAFNYFVPKCCKQKTLHSWYSCGKAKTSISQNADIPKFGGAKSEAVWSSLSNTWEESGRSPLSPPKCVCVWGVHWVFLAIPWKCAQTSWGRNGRANCGAWLTGRKEASGFGTEWMWISKEGFLLALWASERH